MQWPACTYYFPARTAMSTCTWPSASQASLDCKHWLTLLEGLLCYNDIDIKYETIYSTCFTYYTNVWRLWSHSFPLPHFLRLHHASPAQGLEHLCFGAFITRDGYNASSSIQMYPNVKKRSNQVATQWAEGVGEWFHAFIRLCQSRSFLEQVLYWTKRFQCRRLAPPKSGTTFFCLVRFCLVLG